MKIALLLSTYNWPEALELVLKSIVQLHMLPDEVLIADDGSTSDTKVVVDRFRESVPITVTHVWQEDHGFKRSAILNKAIAQSTADYIVQTDGDCILHPNFIKDHKSSLKKGQFLFGSRVNLIKTGLQPLFETQNIRFTSFSKGIKNRTRAIHFPILSNFYGITDQLSKKVRGCNLSFWRDDFIAVNGYNEDMTGWGREDSEFVIRLLNSGLKGRRLRYKAIIYHIWHKSSSKSKVTINQEIQEATVAQKLSRCTNGVAKYL